MRGDGGEYVRDLSFCAGLSINQGIQSTGCRDEWSDMARWLISMAYALHKEQE